ALASCLSGRSSELTAREHLVVRRKSEGTTREFDARPSIVALDVGSEERSTVLDCHLRFTPRAAVRPEELLMELLPEVDPRGADQRRHVGDIYKGRINAVLPGMQAAFVDLGLPKTGFLHASDLAESLSGLDDISDLEENGDRRRRRPPPPKIEDHLKKGQEILVQITKESIGTKGPRVTQQVSLPGRFCVLMPGVDHVGVSRRIEERTERQRIKAIISDLKPKNVGVIARTVGEGKGDPDFAADVKHLSKLW